MGESFFVDTDGIAKSMPGFRALTDQVRRASEHLHGELSSLGECWGNDHSGQEFAKEYLPAKDQMADGVEQLYKVLQSTGDGIETMAKGFARNEQQNGEAAARLMPQTPSVPSEPSGGPHPHSSTGHHG
jgi:uncharacterized protein YukE